MMCAHMSDDQILCVCAREHERVMHSCDDAALPLLDEHERACPHAQFVMHMRSFLKDIGATIDSRLVRCCGTIAVGARYHEVMRNVRRYAHSLARTLSCNVHSECDALLFALEGLCCKTHGFFGHCLRSACATDNVSVHHPTELQDPAVWMLVRAIAGAPETLANELVAAMQQRFPHALAACGFLMLLIRTPLASALLTTGPPDEHGLSPLFSAMRDAVDPARQRSPIDVVACTSSGSLEFPGSELVCQQFERLARAWVSPCADSRVRHEQEFVHTGTVTSRALSLHRLARSDPHIHSKPWMHFTKRVAVALETVRGAPEPDRAAEVWSSVWRNTRSVLGLSSRIVTRRACTSALILWFYHGDVLYCVARTLQPLSPERGVQWAARCADAFESCARGVAGECDALPSAPLSRVAKHAAVAMPDWQQRWRCATFAKDATTRAVLRAKTMGSAVHVAQGPFRHSSAVAVFSFSQ